MLIQNELYFIRETIKKDVEDRILLMRYEVRFDVISVVNYH